MYKTLFSLLGALSLAAQAADKPNIVFILADDMSYDSVSGLNSAMGPLKTPNIDKLIPQSMTFTDGHSGSAVCTPTRYGILTGRYSWRSRLKSAVLWDYGRPLIEDELLTYPEFLQKEGYTTGMIGKWHLGLDWKDAEGKDANANVKDQDAFFKNAKMKEKLAAVEKSIDFTKPVTGGPLDHGFDYWSGVDLPNMPPYTWIKNRNADPLPTEMKPNDMFGHPGVMAPGWKLEDILPRLGTESAQWIKEQSKQEKPFFLYLPLTSPHTPISPSKPWQGQSVTPYADFIMETDAVIGQVVKALEEAGVADNTILIFTADNGSSAHKGQLDKLKKNGIDVRHHFKGQKAQIHEGGHRVPLIVRWPGKVKAGSKCEEVVCLNDFYATTAALLGKKLPETAAVDSTNLLPLLTGEKELLKDRPLVVNHDIGGRFAIRKGPYKLVLLNKVQLFHLGNDPKESKDISQEHPELVKELAGELAKMIHNGRSTAGPKQKNDGVIPFPKSVLTQFPELKQ